jgi:hypothetical protein
MDAVHRLNGSWYICINLQMCLRYSQSSCESLREIITDDLGPRRWFGCLEIFHLISNDFNEILIKND